MEQSLSNLYGAFSIEFKMQGEPWLLHIIPEMINNAEKYFNRRS